MRVAPRLLLLLLPLQACAPEPPAPARAEITNGAPDPNDPAVVGIVNPAGVVGCSGTLIAPHTVLTAAHCMVGSYDGDRVFFGSSVAAGGTFADVTRAVTDPAFDPGTLANDFALLTLRQAGPAAPLPLDPRTLDATLVGQSFQAVGFGVTGPGAGDAGEKRTGTAQVTALDPTDFTTAPMPSSPCEADSGGPALFTVQGTTYVTGVTSHGDSACADHAAYARVDTALGSFITPALAASAPGSATVGDPCGYDAECASGSCLAATDEPKLSFCSQPCKVASDCPKAMTCAQDGCRYPAPSPGALGSACAQASDCVSALCDVARPGAPGVCATRCVALGQSCPAGFTCRNENGGVDFYCLRSSRSGCQLGAGDPTSALPLLLLLFGCALWRRRIAR